MAVYKREGGIYVAQETERDRNGLTEEVTFESVRKVLDWEWKNILANRRLTKVPRGVIVCAMVLDSKSGSDLGEGMIEIVIHSVCVCVCGCARMIFFTGE